MLSFLVPTCSDQTRVRTLLQVLLGAEMRRAFQVSHKAKGVVGEKREREREAIIYQKILPNRKYTMFGWSFFWNPGRNCCCHFGSFGTSLHFFFFFKYMRYLQYPILIHRNMKSPNRLSLRSLRSLRRASSRPWSTVAPPCQLTRRCSRTSVCMMVSERWSPVSIVGIIEPLCNDIISQYMTRYHISNVLNCCFSCHYWQSNTFSGISPVIEGWVTPLLCSPLGP